MQISISLVRNEQGKPLYFFSQTQDISESKKKKKEKLQELEKLHRLITDNSQDIFYYSRADSVVQYVSPAIKKILGNDPDELVGRSGLYLWHPGDLENYISLRDIKREYVNAEYATKKVIMYGSKFRLIRSQMI